MGPDSKPQRRDGSDMKSGCFKNGSIDSYEDSLDGPVLVATGSTSGSVGLYCLRGNSSLDLSVYLFVLNNVLSIQFNRASIV